ncbi:hypothetical protein [Thioalkalivibrio sp. ALE23]|uniref:hypothetical protein n=1 Tax=Thioalkalivibrio sp. ALE23 TaxID=1265495 RepID=UPI0012DF3E50|nr:hypothetical protein [Thioalkalivibrio sp. ALE23]
MYEGDVGHHSDGMENEREWTFTHVYWEPIEFSGERICVGSFLLDEERGERILALPLGPEDMDRVTDNGGEWLRADLEACFRRPTPFPLPPNVTLGRSVSIIAETAREAAETALRFHAAFMRPEGPEILRMGNQVKSGRSEWPDVVTESERKQQEEAV